jgi:hypothetical protein
LEHISTQDVTQFGQRILNFNLFKFMKKLRCEINCEILNYLCEDIFYGVI